LDDARARIAKIEQRLKLLEAPIPAPLPAVQGGKPTYVRVAGGPDTTRRKATQPSSTPYSLPTKRSTSVFIFVIVIVVFFVLIFILNATPRRLRHLCIGC